MVKALAYLCLFALAVNGVSSSNQGMQDAMEIQRDQLDRLNSFLGPGPQAQTRSVTKRQSPITFANPAAQKFYVDGTKIPDGTGKV